MKFVVVSDPHINEYSRFDENGSRLDNTIEAVANAFKEADLIGAQWVLMCGDLFDSPKLIHTKAMIKTVAMFKLMQRQYPDIVMLAITGNHDLATNSIYGQPVVSAVKLIDMTCENVIHLDGNRFPMDLDADGSIGVYGIRYYKYAEDYQRALDNLIEVNYIEKDRYKILMIHQSPNEADGFIEQHLSVEDPVYKKFDLVLCGHIHKHQKLSDNFIVVGSPLFRDMADAGQPKGYLVIDTDHPEISPFRKLTDFPDYSLLVSDTEEEDEGPVQDSNEPEFNYSQLVGNELIRLYLNNIGVSDAEIYNMGVKLLGS